MIRVFMVAKFFGIDAASILRWTNPMLLDAVEYIELYGEAERRQADHQERLLDQERARWRQ